MLARKALEAALDLLNQCLPPGNWQPRPGDASGRGSASLRGLLLPGRQVWSSGFCQALHGLSVLARRREWPDRCELGAGIALALATAGEQRKAPARGPEQAETDSRWKEHQHEKYQEVLRAFTGLTPGDELAAGWRL